VFHNKTVLSHSKSVHLSRDVGNQGITPIREAFARLRCYAVKEEILLGLLVPWKWDLLAVPKRW